jgi:hypothetical protein
LCPGCPGGKLIVLKSRSGLSGATLREISGAESSAPYATF